MDVDAVDRDHAEERVGRLVRDQQGILLSGRARDVEPAAVARNTRMRSPVLSRLRHGHVDERRRACTAPASTRQQGREPASQGLLHVLLLSVGTHRCKRCSKGERG